MSRAGDVSMQLAEIARTAGDALLDVPPETMDRRQKPSGEWVTTADEASHRLLRRMLAEAFPDTPAVLEEQDNALPLPDTCLAVDELDGTHVFMNGLGDWGVSLALIEDGRPLAGVLHQPATGVLIRAARDEGCWVGDQRLTFGGVTSLSGRLIGAEVNRYLPWGEFVWIGALARQCAGVRGLATAVGNAVELLLGGTVLFVNARGGKLWDFAAAALAVEEAGGVALSCSGEPLRWSAIEMSALFAANAAVAEQALSLRAEAGEPG